MGTGSFRLFTLGLPPTCAGLSRLDGENSVLCVRELTEHFLDG